MSDSEYSVNDSQQSVNTVPQSCPANGECCGCCAHCPLNSLAPENLEATLQRHSTFIDEFQGAIFYRRPIAFVALLVSVNLVFFLYRSLKLNIYSLVCLLVIIYIAIQLVPSAIFSTVKGVLLPGQLDKGNMNDPNRVRDTNELVAPINKLLYPVFGFLKIVNALSKDESVTGLLIYGSVFFCLFCITASVDFFWPIVIFTNFALILPGVLTLPPVVPYVQKVKEHITAHAEDDAAPASNNQVQDAFINIASDANNALNQAGSAVNEVVDDIKQKVEEQ